MTKITRNGDNTDITMTRGDSFYAVVSMQRNSGGEYTPVEGDVVRFAAKNKSGEVALRKELTTDTLLLHIRPDETKTLALGVYWYDIRLTTVSGDVDTFIKGSFWLTDEVE